MKQLILLTIVLLTPLHAQEAKTPAQPTPYPPKTETPTITKMPLAFTKLVIFPADTLKWKQLSNEVIKEKFQSAIPQDHAAYNLTPRVALILPHLKSSKSQWVLYDATKEEFVAKLAPTSAKHLKKILIDTFEYPAPLQISLQATITSVTRPKDPYLTWNQDLINQHDPKIVTTFSVTSRSGEKATIEVPSDAKYSHSLEFKPTLYDDLKYIDLRLAIQIHPTKTYPGITLNTGLTVSSGKPFIHPIGLTTDPNKITILTLHLKPITPTATPYKE